MKSDRGGHWRDELPRAPKLQDPLPRDELKTHYRVTNWPEYERGLVQRGNVTVWLSNEAIGTWRAQPTGKRGAQPKFSDLAIETALT